MGYIRQDLEEEIVRCNCIIQFLQLERNVEIIVKKINVSSSQSPNRSAEDAMTCRFVHYCDDLGPRAGKSMPSLSYRPRLIHLLKLHY